ncbi:hypothetical protein E1A91_D11G208000v1 [Gossypium mustelinum]|uniref:Uncharacterized protein n=1 Tax=Gossypium mustelinum TaxID=34275 RepID=A0A5D2STZ5_GOSMU|nr:hypothetical protein E1A91_D11G208000v1 [Gossypium mustelinum]
MDEIEKSLDENDIRKVHTMHDYLQPSQNSTPSCFDLLFNANNFRFKLGVITLLPNFLGLEFKSPYLHLKDFDEVCATFNDPPYANEIDKLKLFPLSLKDKVKIGFNNLKPRSIGTSQEMQTKFLKKIFQHKRPMLSKNRFKISCKIQINHFFNVGNISKIC